jgi:hypothetical protein
MQISSISSVAPMNSGLSGQPLAGEDGVVERGRFERGAFHGCAHK